MNNVHPVLGPWHLGDQHLVGVADGHEVVLDVGGEADLVQLPNADDVRLQPRNPVHAGQLAVTPVVDGEEDGPTPTDLHDGPVAEAYLAGDGLVKLSEDGVVARHVVRSAGVQVPRRVEVLWRALEDDVCALLVQVHLLSCRWHNGGRSRSIWHGEKGGSVGFALVLDDGGHVHLLAILFLFDQVCCCRRCLIALLLAAVALPMALLLAVATLVAVDIVVAFVRRWWLGLVLASAAVAAAGAAATVAAGATAATTALPFLLLQLLLGEEELTTGVALLAVETFLDSPEMSHHLLHGVAEGAESGGKGGDPQAELIHSLPFPERDGLELCPEPPHARVPHVAVALVLQPDRLPGRHGAALANQHGVHLWRGRAKQGGERLLVLASGDAVILDRVPQACSLQVHLHHYRPIGVLPPLQHREDEAGAAAAAALAHHLAMHDDLSASTPNSATPAAWRAPSLFGRRSDGLAGGLSRGSALIRWWWSVAGVRAIAGHCSALLL